MSRRRRDVPLIGLNRIKTWILIAALGGLFVLIGAWIGGPSGAIVALAIALVFTFWMYWFSDKIASSPTRAKPVSGQERPGRYRFSAELTPSTRIRLPGPY